jgi:Putative Actinobacterial Holin-X, holin superfamily III
MHLLDMPDEEIPRHDLSSLLETLWRDGFELGKVELQLSRRQVKQIFRSYVMAALLGFCALAFFLLSISMLAHAFALALARYFNSLTEGYVAVAIVLLVLATLFALAGKRYYTKKQRPVGLVFKSLSSIFKDRSS